MDGLGWTYFHSITRVLIFVLLILGCQTPKSPTNKQVETPNWTFKNVTWQSQFKGGSIKFQSKEVKQFETRIEGKSLSFSYSSNIQDVTGKAQRSVFIPTKRTMSLDNLSFQDDTTGKLSAKRGIMDFETDKLSMTQVTGTFRSQSMQVESPSATLSFMDNDEFILETSKVHGHITPQAEQDVDP